MTSRLDTLPRNQILTGDALDHLRTLPDASVDCVITSPPYYRLRNYGHADQLGMERHVNGWVDQLREVLRETARVLVPTGTVWLNLGDSYSTRTTEGAPRKSLLLGPERLALALIADGWTIRNKIVWAKTNTIPTSVTDRLATKHEIIYLLTRQPRYYFDLHEIRQPHASRPPKRRDPSRPAYQAVPPVWRGPNADGDLGLAAMKAAGIVGHPMGKNPGDIWHLPVSTYRGAHFATFPEPLVTRMLLAGCPLLRCTRCRRPWTRTLIRLGPHATRRPPRPTCACDADAEPGLVLDPFIGAGTTALAARKTGRDWLGIELNPDYVHLAEERIHATQSQPDENNSSQGTSTSTSLTRPKGGTP